MAYMKLIMKPLMIYYPIYIDSSLIMGLVMQYAKEIATIYPGFWCWTMYTFRLTGPFHSKKSDYWFLLKVKGEGSLTFQNTFLNPISYSPRNQTNINLLQEEQTNNNKYSPSWLGEKIVLHNT